MMEFSFDDYTELLSKKSLIYPKNFTPNFLIDTSKYDLLAKEYSSKGLKIPEALEGLKYRTGYEYFLKIYITQSLAMNFSESSFPAYRFLLPDILVDDWLSIVDLHKSNCRDHSIHQPLTSYIVFKLLGGGRSEDSFKIDDEPLLDLCIKSLLKHDKSNLIYEYAVSTCYNKAIDITHHHNIAYSVWKQLFYETAMKAAIFHDMGYPWQFINRINSSIKNSDFRFEEINTHSTQVLTNFANRLILAPFWGYQSTRIPPSTWNDTLINLISKSLTQTHGFPGALSFLYLNDLIRKYPDENKYKLHQFSIEWAALGIMMHDMKNIYWGNNKKQPENKFLRLSFDKDPLSCIICLADLLQEFERPFVKLSFSNSSSNFEYSYSCKQSSLRQSNSLLEIYYHFRNDSFKAVNKKFKQKEEFEFFDQKYGYLDFSSIGIKSVKLICQ